MTDMENRQIRAPSDWTYLPEPARIVSIRREKMDAVIALELADGRPLGHMPGQFVQISRLGYGEIPISVCSTPTRPERFKICVRPVGHVSDALYKASEGDWVGIRGPFGRGFPVRTMRDRDILVAAGGIGLAPLRSLIQYIRDNRADYRRIIIVYGARNPSLILFREDVNTWTRDSDTEMFLTVDEGDESWNGRTGVLTQPIKEEIELNPRETVAAVVGPPVMYRFVALELLAKGVRNRRIFFSLERHFKCGIGKCGHCQLNGVYVCQDGPVFRYSDLTRLTEAVEARAPEE
ncbi:MAG: FAD/NAD(P)-binding protein [Deltaproteobacteria bacterium]|nr:FAD/NAD(P)-binding protein [Deltaproteobacteria bacterium]